MLDAALKRRSTITATGCNNSETAQADCWTRGQGLSGPKHPVLLL